MLGGLQPVFAILCTIDGGAGTASGPATGGTPTTLDLRAPLGAVLAMISRSPRVFAALSSRHRHRATGAPGLHAPPASWQPGGGPGGFGVLTARGGFVAAGAGGAGAHGNARVAPYLGTDTGAKPHGRGPFAFLSHAKFPVNGIDLLVALLAASAIFATGIGIRRLTLRLLPR